MNENFSKEEKAPKLNFKHVLKEYIIPLTIELVIVILLLRYVFFLAHVPTGSMIPTISEESWIFSTHIHRPEERISRGDIIVFAANNDPKTLIKRCIGLPGESVFIDSRGVVYINDVMLEENYVSALQPGEPQYFEVPEDCYLFFGDNRPGSADARAWTEPYIPASSIIGEAHFTLWPLSDFGFLN